METTSKSLRRRAEDLLRVQENPVPSDGDDQRLLHELQVHQIELEMQNQALHETQEALQESRDRYADLYEYAPIGYLILSAEGNILKMNVTAADYLRVDRLQVQLQPFAAQVAHDEQDRWQRYFLRLNQDGEQGSLELRLQRGDGTEFHAQLNCARDSSSTDQAAEHPPATPSVVQVVLTDISSRKQVELELRSAKLNLEAQVADRTAELVKAAENTRLFIKHAPISIAMFDREMNYLAASGRWIAQYAHYGHGPADLVGLNHYEIMPELPQQWIQAHRQGLAGKTVNNDEDLWLRSDGSKIWLRWAVVPWTTPDGSIGGIIISSEDISESKRAAEALRESESRFHILADSAPVLIWVADAQGRRTWFNKGWINFTGRGMEQDLGMGWHAEVHSEDLQTYLTLYEVSIARREAFEISYRLRHAAGEYRWVLARGVPFLDPGGNFGGFIGCCTDISLQKDAELQIAEARDAAEQATTAKSAFLANMSHEIRTPLNVIIGLSHLIHRDLDDPMQRGRLDQLCASSEHLLALINDILDLSKIEAQRIVLDNQDFRLDVVVNRVLRMESSLAQESGIILCADIAPALLGLVVNGDALRLSQVLINLVNNAIKFTDRGTVTLSIEASVGDDSLLKLRFAVRDTGMGISPTDQRRLFQAFEQMDNSTTRARGGTGLGLTISQRLVELMGGSIQVASHPGEGSTFHFELAMPLGRPGLPGSETEASDLPAFHFQGRRILFAEDHQQSQEILLDMLGGIGCEADVAGDGIEAVVCAKARHYDLILMDMQMPGMDGMTATRVIRTLPGYRETPIVALTANAFFEDRQRCLDAGMNDHLAKPVTPFSLAAALGKWLPDLKLPVSAAPQRSDEISRALAGIPGLEVAADWRSSPQRMTAYCAQLLTFVARQGQDMKQMHGCLASGDRAGARVLAHNLNGVAGLLGARRIATLASEISQAIHTGTAGADLESLLLACDAELVSLAQAVTALPFPAARL